MQGYNKDITHVQRKILTRGTFILWQFDEDSCTWRTREWNKHFPCTKVGLCNSKVTNLIRVLEHGELGDGKHTCAKVSQVTNNMISMVLERGYLGNGNPYNTILHCLLSYTFSVFSTP